MASPRFSAAPVRGFTLIELLVAISIMALMAILGWRGLDGMSRAQVATQARADEVLTLQAGLGQWSADLDALVQIPQTQSLDWDGRALRITRRSSQPNDPGPLVVAWTRRNNNQGVGQWLRWQSPPVRTRADWRQAWEQAAQWARTPGDAERRYEVTLRNEQATLAQMRAIHPFDPATIPDRTRIEVQGRDYAGTPLEASFRALAGANGLDAIDDLRLSLEMTADGTLRVDRARIVLPDDCYAGVRMRASEFLPGRGVSVQCVDMADLAAVESAVRQVYGLG